MSSSQGLKRCSALFLACLLLLIVISGYVVRYTDLYSNFYQLPNKVPIASLSPDDDILTNRETRYILYGEGNKTWKTDAALYNYVRSMTSRQTPDAPRLVGNSRQLHYSQIGASQYVDQKLNGRRNGVFLECGAADGQWLSNSLFFELHRNWTGILIEGSPDRVRSLIQRNRNSYVIRGCLSVTANPEMTSFRYSRGGLSETDDRYSVYHLKNHSKLPSRTEVYVHCFPLMSILAALGIHHIDYMSLDIEGGEVGVLQTVDWTQLTVDIITIEYGADVNRLQKLKSLLENAGRYRIAGYLPVGHEPSLAQDVVFERY